MPPLWSGGVAALLIAAASVVMRAGAECCSESFGAVIKAVAGIMVFFATAQGILGWGAWLPLGLSAPVMAGWSAGLSAAAILLQRRLAFAELAYSGLMFLVAASWRGWGTDEIWALPVTGGFALAGAWIWHWWERQADDEVKTILLPELHGWAYAVAVALAALVQIGRHSGDDSTLKVVWLGGVALGLTAFAVFLKTERLAACATVLNGLGLFVLFERPASPVPIACLIGFSLAIFALLFFCGADLQSEQSKGSSWIARATAFFATCGFWYRFTPEFHGDGLAVTGVLLLLIAVKRRIPAMIEVWGFLGWSVLWLLSVSVFGWGKIGDAATWRGWAVIVALWGLVVWRSVGNPGENRTTATGALGWTACVMTSLWTTQMLVWRYDWNAASVLWTVLGFVFVSAGLALHVANLRQAGFGLLAIAVGKVFVVDVWDFEAFMRVIAFIVLGLALTLLGLFYNRFAPMLKKLLEEETEAQP